MPLNLTVQLPNSGLQRMGVSLGEKKGVYVGCGVWGVEGLASLKDTLHRFNTLSEHSSGGG